MMSNVAIREENGIPQINSAVSIREVSIICVQLQLEDPK